MTKLDEQGRANFESINGLQDLIRNISGGAGSKSSRLSRESMRS